MGRGLVRVRSNTRIRAERSHDGTPGTYTTKLTPDPSEEQAGLKEQDMETRGQE